MDEALYNVFILLIALVMDYTLGEPPRFLHPVVWMGKVISLWEKAAPRSGSLAQLIYGAVAVLVTMALFAMPAYYLLAFLKGISPIVYVIAGALLLKTTFSVKELRTQAVETRELLLKDHLDRARWHLRSLVSRRTDKLSKPLLVAATIESVAENISDSFVAPLLYFVLFGIPGAVAYRVVNTFDAMIGYRGEYEYLGKPAARLDDVLNFIPARLAGLIMVIAALFSRNNASSAWRVMLRDHAKTESPNAGWTMSAAAGALGVELEKAGYYKLGDAWVAPSPQIIDELLQMIQVVVVLWTLVCLFLEVMRFVFSS